jgi:hypothetical protein
MYSWTWCLCWARNINLHTVQYPETEITHVCILEWASYCHESRPRWCLFPFGWRLAVVVAGLLAAIDSLSVCFCLLGLIGYTCFELVFVCRLFKGTRPAGYLCGLVLCYFGVGVLVLSHYFPDSFSPVYFGRVVSYALVLACPCLRCRWNK